jgi:hypothetical protein
LPATLSLLLIIKKRIGIGTPEITVSVLPLPTKKVITLLILILKLIWLSEIPPLILILLKTIVVWPSKIPILSLTPLIWSETVIKITILILIWTPLILKPTAKVTIVRILSPLPWKAIVIVGVGVGSS